MSSSSSRIAALNDSFRTTLEGGQLFITDGLSAHGIVPAWSAIAVVQAFDAFTPDNDPYGEHDFGSLEVEGIGLVFWKIDYYDPTFTAGSEDPADPACTGRTLTVMLASEY